MTELHQDSLGELKREIDAITCEGCRRNEPIIIHDGTPISMAALKGKVFHTSGRCTSKADEFLPLFNNVIVANFEEAAWKLTGKAFPMTPRDEAEACVTMCDVQEVFRALSPASARRQLQLDLLRARLEAVNYVIAHAPGRLPQLVQDYIARLESEIAALEAQ